LGLRIPASLSDTHVLGRSSLARERALIVGAVALACLAGSFALWDPLEIDERTHIRRISRHSAEGARADLEAELRALFAAQSSLARAWESVDVLAHEEWRTEAELFLGSHAGVRAVEWRDPTRGRVWTFSRAGTSAQDVPLPPVAEAASGVLLRDASGGLFMMNVTRVGTSGADSPRLLVSLDLDQALARMLSSHRELGYHKSVWYGEQLLYRTQGGDEQLEAKWGVWSELRLPQAPWRVRVWPSPQLLSEMRSPLPELAFVVGGLLGVLLTIALRRARAAQLRSAELERANLAVEERVRQRTRELTTLSARLLRLQDEERRRLARELHDSTAQTLAAAAIGLERAASALRGQRAAEVETLLAETSGLVATATTEVRTLSFLLHPPVLHDLGLEYALPWLAEGFSRRSGIDVRVNVAEGLGRLPEDVETTLYRVVQESLANVHHHSGSPTAEIDLARNPGGVALDVADHGSGLEAALKRDATAVELGVGISGMRERVRQLGGEFEVVSDQGGTLVRVVLPVPGTVVAPQGHGSVGTAA
jgi:signal transduction histidine kinase